MHKPLQESLAADHSFFFSNSTCVFDIIRLVVFLDMPEASPDLTWINLPPAMWLDIEASVAILCACLPVMRPLIHPKRFWYHHHRPAGASGDRDTGEDGFQSPESDRGAVTDVEKNGGSDEVPRIKSSGGVSGMSGSQSDEVPTKVDKEADGKRNSRLRTSSTGPLQARGAGRAV